MSVRPDMTEILQRVVSKSERRQESWHRIWAKETKRQDREGERYAAETGRTKRRIGV